MNYIAEWLDGYRRFWELRMERIEEYLRKLQEKDREVLDTRSKSAVKNTGKVDRDDSKH
ncbi:hypothetical protein VVD49_16970 [Uliginosibacterium sp. H3]|uniref:Uncharacterized protein n=1 Tax=Uliginosibacterium silvisoli TaxID=3114758 RepID=A0ABU6K831_9RHOO|nr:hypothetical protein [Uliginosibacterium sp. H3]